MVVAHVNTTTLFNEATPSTTATGLWDLETFSDNNTVAKNTLSMASNRGDTFHRTESDADDWKWDITSSTATYLTVNIGETYADKLYCLLGLSESEWVYITNVGTLTTITDARCDMTYLTYPVNVTGTRLTFEIYNTTSTNIYIRGGFCGVDANNPSMYGEVRDTGETASSTVTAELDYTVDNRYQFRLYTDGALGYVYYRSGDYELPSNEDWTLLHTATFASNAIGTRFYARTSGLDQIGFTLNNFMLNGTGGTFVTTSATWTTPTIGASDYDLNQIILNVADCNSTNYIDRIEIYDNSDLNTIITSYTTNVFTNRILTGADFGSALTPCTGTAITMKMYFVSDGTKRPSISQLTLSYADTSTSDVTWGDYYLSTEAPQ